MEISIVCVAGIIYAPLNQKLICNETELLQFNCCAFFFLSFYNLMLPTIQTLHLNIRIFLTPELYIMSKGKNEDILVSTPDPECFLGKQIPILPSLLSVFLFISTSITSYCLTALLSHAQMLKDGVNL